MSRKRKKVVLVPARTPEPEPAKGDVLWRARHIHSPSITTTVWAHPMAAVVARQRAAVKLQCEPLHLEVEKC